MRVRGWNIVRHRGVRDAQIEGLANGMTVIYGPNGSGKSTISDFLSKQIFGAKRKEDAPEGWVRIESDGQELVFSRKDRKSGGSEVTDRAGNPVGSPPSFAKPEIGELFDSVFKMSLDTNAAGQVVNVVRNELAIVAASDGGKAAVGLRDDLRKRTDEIYRKRAPTTTINQLRNRLKSARAELAQAVSESTTVRQIERQLEEAVLLEAQFDEREKQLVEESARVDTALNASKLLGLIAEKERRLESLRPVLDRAQYAEAESLLERSSTLAEEEAIAQQDLAKQVQRLEKAPANEQALVYRNQIEELVREHENLRANSVDLAKTRSYIKVLSDQLGSLEVNDQETRERPSAGGKILAVGLVGLVLVGGGAWLLGSGQTAGVAAMLIGAVCLAVTLIFARPQNRSLAVAPALAAEAQSLRREMADKQSSLDGYAERQAKLNSAVSGLAQTLGVDADPNSLAELLSEARDLAARRKNSEEYVDEANSTVALLAERRTQLDAEASDLCQSAGTQSIDELELRCQATKEYIKVEAELEELRAATAAQLPTELDRRLASELIDAEGISGLKARAAMLEAEKSEHTRLAREQGATRNNLQRTLEEIGSSSRVIELSMDVESLESEIRAAFAEYVEAQIAYQIVDGALEEFRRERQPELLRYAAKSFAELTGNRYQNIFDGEDDQIRVETVDGQIQTVDELSSGTRDQLMLCLRIAYAQTQVAAGDDLPFVFDDAMLTFDDAHSPRAATMIGRLAHDHQVIVLTCHSAFRDLLKTADPSAKCFELVSRSA